MFQEGNEIIIHAKGRIILRPDPEFERLCPAISPEEYFALENEILSSGQREAVIVWNGIIVYGTCIYEICREHCLMVTVCQKEFKNRDEAIRWIVINHPAAPMTHPACFKYQIGKRYLAERALKSSKRKRSDQEQYDSGLTDVKRTSPTSLADLYGISHFALNTYREMAMAIDRISQGDGRLTDLYLAGRLRIKKEDLMTIAELPVGFLRSLTNDIIRNKKAICRNEDILNALSSRDLEKENQADRERRKAESLKVKPSVKDMPVFDPDSAVASLSLTIPSWNSSIERVFGRTDFKAISVGAGKQLKQELISLRDTIELVLITLEENNNG